MSETSDTTEKTFWEKNHPVNTRKERLCLFEELVKTLQDLIGGRKAQTGPTQQSAAPAFPKEESIVKIIKYYREINEHNLAFRLSEDYLKDRETDTDALKTYVTQLTEQRNAKNPATMVRKLREAEKLLAEAAFPDSELANRDDLILDLKLSIAEHLPHLEGKKSELNSAIKLADTYLKQHTDNKDIFLLQKAIFYSRLGSLQRNINEKVTSYLKSMEMLHELNEINKEIDCANIILINFEDLLSISQTDDECKLMIEIIEKSFTSFIDDAKSPTPHILHNLSWLYYKKALITKYDTERDFYLTKSEHFLTKKDSLSQETASSDNLRAHIASLKAENEQTEIKKLHYIYDCIELYNKAKDRAPHITAIRAFIADSYLRLAEEERDVFKRINLVETAIEEALTSSRVGIDVSFSHKVLAKAYKILEDTHSDPRQKELYHTKKLQYEELLH